MDLLKNIMINFQEIMEEKNGSQVKTFFILRVNTVFFC